MNKTKQACDEWIKLLSELAANISPVLNIATMTDRLQQTLQLAELPVTHLRLHLDFIDDPLKPFKSRCIKQQIDCQQGLQTMCGGCKVFGQEKKNDFTTTCHKDV